MASRRRLAEASKPREDVSACSRLLHPKHKAGDTLRLTGMYSPPSAHATPSKVQAITTKDNQTRTATGEIVSHLPAGCMNQHSWQGGTGTQYHEWMGGAEMLELSYPAKSPHIKGSSLDIFLLPPDTQIPDCWLPPMASSMVDNDEGDALALGLEQLDEEPLYPPCSYGLPVIAYHYPVILCLKGAMDGVQSSSRVMRLGELGPEEWRGRDERQSPYSNECADQLLRRGRGGNPTKLLDTICRGKQSVPSDKYRRAANASKDMDPFAPFYLRHIADPDYLLGVRSSVEGNESMKRQLMNKMSRNGRPTSIECVRLTPALCSHA